ncbi:hypothetical protein VTK56DRAFT_1574 [Thermocarpiscus australiensis]
MANASWQFKKVTGSSSNGKFKFERESNANGEIKQSSDPIEPREAMLRCLAEVEESCSDTIP